MKFLKTILIFVLFSGIVKAESSINDAVLKNKYLSQGVKSLIGCISKHGTISDDNKAIKIPLENTLAECKSQLLKPDPKYLSELVKEIKPSNYTYDTAKMMSCLSNEGDPDSVINEKSLFEICEALTVKLAEIPEF